MNEPAMAPGNGSGTGGGIGVGEGKGLGPGNGYGFGGGVFRVGNGRPGELNGVIKDASGAVIPNVKLNAINNSTGVSQTAFTDSMGRYNFHGLASGSYTVTAQAPGFQIASNRNLNLSATNSNTFDAHLNVGSAAETVDVSAETSPVSVADAIDSLESEAEGQELGDLFEYKLKQRVTIGKNQSALVPIVHANIEADKVSLWNPEHPRALRAIWVTNTSGDSLDSGTFNILEDNTFAGEGVMEMIKPGEKRLLSYAVDQGVHVDAESGTESEKITRVRILHGLMTQTRGRREQKIYKVRNADTDERKVVIEHPLRAGWKLTSETKPVESTSDYHRFMVPVESGKTAELTVEEFEPQETSVAVSSISDQQIALYLKQRSITPEMEQTLRKVIAQKNDIAAVDQQIQKRQQETNEISQDQQRVRENMKALKGTAEEKQLTQRYASQLNQQEDRLATLRTETKDLETQKTALQSKLFQMIEDISFDVTL